MRISPLDPAFASFIAGAAVAHLISDRFDKALVAARSAIQESPNYAVAHRLVVLALGHLGRLDEARLAARRLLELTPEFTVSRYNSISAFKDAGIRRRSAEIYRASGVPN